jgi:hypothetical protein
VDIRVLKVKNLRDREVVEIEKAGKTLVLLIDVFGLAAILDLEREVQVQTTG